MTTFYSVYLRTAESVWALKSFLEGILEKPFVKYKSGKEEFYTNFLGLTLHLKDLGADSANELVHYQDEIIPLSNYDLEITLSYDRNAFIRNYADEWKRSVAVKLADKIALNWSCESIVVKDCHYVIDRFMPFEERTTPRCDDE